MMLVLAQEAADQTYLLWGLILVAVAVALVLLELFIPSGGILAGIAGVAAIGSVTAFFMHDTTGGVVSIGLYLVLTPIFLWAVFKYWIHSPMARHMILGAEEMDSQPGSDSESRRQERLNQLRALIGAEGVTVTALRPVGTVRIEGQRIDALAESGTIAAKTPIVVTDVYDNQIKVRPVE
jgi:membrane-bound ClpP family serine protease